MLSLFFFVPVLLFSCGSDSPDEIEINWKNEQAVSISIPRKLLSTIPTDSVASLLAVSLAGNKASILGKIKPEKDALVFIPLVPFTRGLNYEILVRDITIKKITIPSADQKNAPLIVGVYPSSDSLPENLLKFYFQFSASMREGEALTHIELLNDRNEKIPNVFLELQPELWNEGRTALTVWLDPGRIKRELIPNKEMGNPLSEGREYILKVSSDWKNAQGLPLQAAYTKKFRVVSRDSLSPNPQNWNMNLPAAETRDPMTITLNESLDFFLLQETLSVILENGTLLKGSWTISDKESIIQFKPQNFWARGEYKLRIASHLEDLAGNNLNKPFDRDITIRQTKRETAYHERNFRIR